VNYSVLDPLAIKAFHLHARQTDVWYVPPSDKLLLVLADVRKGSPTEGSHALRDRRRELAPRADPAGRRARVQEPPAGLADGDPVLRRRPVLAGADTDEGRLPWDHFGSEIWDVARE
jgi:dTDP-4-dehydrorhamnose 3,5-epimerase